MANTYNWYSTASSCPGATNTQPGWYSGETFITASYKNPSTGLAYTPHELEAMMGGTTPTAPTGGYTPMPGHPGWHATPEEQAAAQAEYISGGWGAGAGEAVSPVPTTPITPTPVFGEGAAAGIPTPTITPAPPYVISPEMQEMMDLYGDKLTDWVTSGGYGLSPEVQAQMIQVQTDTLKAREQEALRVMKNNMERRGITNSGYLQSNENMIHSNTSVAIAGAIADVQIKSAVLKIASFEKAMGQMAQFLGFLSEQSQLAYAPEFATWQAEQLATMQHWQGKLDLYKMELNQAYQTQNILLQGQIQSEYAEQQQGYNIELAEMEIEANQNIAMAQGIGGIFGTILGFIFGK